MSLTSNVLAALANPSQHERLLRLHTAAGPGVLVAERLTGLESVDGEGFALTVTALSVSAQVDLAGLIGTPVLLELLCADSRSDLRAFHGRVLAASLLGSNGGMARYQLQVAPWLSWLHQRVDSYVFQDMTVMQIVEDVFADYDALLPAWRWALKDASVYSRRSLTVQYEESDFAFVSRLLAEEGIAFWFEHAGAAGSDTLGTHTLVLSDDNEAFADLGTVRFHRSDVTERDDSVQQFRQQRRWRTGTVRRASWDYRQVRRQQAQVEGEGIGEDVDTVGPYAWHTAQEGARRAQQQWDALQVAGSLAHGSGTWRRLAPGRAFRLSAHPATPGPQLCLQVQHLARNNLGAQVIEASEALLGPVTQADLDLPPALSALPWPSVAGMEVATADADDSPRDADTPFYRNRFISLPQSRPYRPQLVDGEGVRRHPRPRVYGVQSAIVVSDGGPVLTDRDHRIKVQFVWQRGADASSGEAHPGGDDNAPGDAGAWTWVRVATPWAGDNWGGVVVPRRGQEVLVAFLEGDIDRPVVVGTVYNGQGQVDAAHNQVAGGGGGATGNAPAWFNGNDHAAVFTGFKSQALAHSQEGTGGYQLLRLDDSAGQGRIQLGTMQQQTWLNLGHFKGGQDNVRAADRGYGFELRTDAYGAVRAGSGLLVGSERGQNQLDAPVALAQLQAQQQLGQSLAEAAQSQQASLPGDAAPLPLHASQAALQQALEARQRGSAAEGIAGGEGEVPGWDAPVLLFSGEAGVVATTPEDQVWVSGTQTGLGASSELNWLSQGGSAWHSADGLLLYSHGSAPAQGKPVQQRGLALHAATGVTSLRAHANQATVAAKDSLALVSTQADILLDAPASHLLATAAGAYIKLEGGNIELGAPGRIEFKASHKQFEGGKALHVPRIQLSRQAMQAPLHWIGLHYLDPDTGEPVDGAEYEIHLKDATIIEGTLDAQGQGEHHGIENTPVNKVIYKPRPPEEEVRTPALEKVLESLDAATNGVVT